MTCAEFEARLQAYVDGELSAELTADGDAHAAECGRCAALARGERAYRVLLRRQPRESAPTELRDRIREALRRERQEAPPSHWWRLSLTAAAAGAVVLVAAMLLSSWRSAPPLVATLVDKHIAYAQLERPAELTSHDPTEIAEWFRRRAGLRVVVPDYSAAGIRLVGARLVDANERGAAYLLYEKGHVLISVFMLTRPAQGTALDGTRVAYRGHEYRRYEQKGYHTVLWTDGAAIYGLISMLDYEALLECADRLRLERART
jgi:mycothiol system anti-sigma-R factor